MTYPDQCGSTLPHPAHDDCPGLDQPRSGEPVDVAACTDCFAPVGEPCRTSNPRTPNTHAARIVTARLRSVEHGTCDLCGQPMVRGVPTVTTTGNEVDAWHPDQTHAAACPRLPDPARDWNAYAAACEGGRSPGRPGIEHFVPAGAVMAPALPLCPECAAGKPLNCVGQALDHTTDDIVPCRTMRELDDQIDCLHGPGAAAALDQAIGPGDNAEPVITISMPGED